MCPLRLGDHVYRETPAPPARRVPRVDSGVSRWSARPTLDSGDQGLIRPKLVKLVTLLGSESETLKRLFVLRGREG